MTNPPLALGDTVQYRKVGTARIVALADRLDSRGGGWFTVEWIRAPKKVREAKNREIYVSPSDRI